MNSDRRNIAGTFTEKFEVIPALDQRDIEEVYRIRHDVYCRDLGWEPIRENGLETDQYDAHSVHCLLRLRSGGSVGCTRLILVRPEDPDHPLPFEDSCQAVIDRNIVDPAKLPRRMVGEVSRLSVLHDFRLRKGEASVPVSVSAEDFESSGGHARFPFIPVSLYLGAAAIARQMQVEYVFVLTEPRLASHFSRIGFDIRCVGGPIEHRGTRVPSLLSSSKVVDGLRSSIRPLYEVIEDSVKTAFAKHVPLLA